jgi:putative phosphoesterase
MRIGVLSDIHGNLPALEAAWPVLRAEAEAFIQLGDLAGYYPFVSEVLALLAEAPVIHLLGNHDAVLVKAIDDGGIPPTYAPKYGLGLERGLARLSESDRALLRALAPEAQIALGGHIFHAAHGAPWHPLSGRVYPDFQQWELFANAPEPGIFLLGHTHYQADLSHGARRIINPGSIGQPRKQGGVAQFAVLDTDQMKLQFFAVSYDVTSLVEDARRHNPDLPYLCEVLQRKARA